MVGEMVPAQTLLGGRTREDHAVAVITSVDLDAKFMSTIPFANNPMTDIC